MKNFKKLALIPYAGILLFLNMITAIDSFADHSKNQSLLSSQNGKSDGLIDIGHGRKMYIKCQGSGSPTVVLISGRSDTSDVWQKVSEPSQSGSVFFEIAKLTHVCAYDRPGTVSITPPDHVLPGRSTVVTQPTTPKNGVADLHALLTAAHIPAPYVLVAHSFGGLIARLYASTYPKEVIGLVLLDVLSEQLLETLTPEQQKTWIRLNSYYSPDLDEYTVQERTDLLSSFAELRAAPAVPSIPAIILTSDQPFDFKAYKEQGILPLDTPEEFASIAFKAHLTGQKHLAALLNAKQIGETHSGHYIQNEQPQLVIQAIKDVLNQAQ